MRWITLLLVGSVIGVGIWYVVYGERHAEPVLSPITQVIERPFHAEGEGESDRIR